VAKFECAGRLAGSGCRFEGEAGANMKNPNGSIACIVILFEADAGERQNGAEYQGHGLHPV
jgi:hypothetical protein